LIELKMDRWKYFNITHQYHEVCDPISSVKIDELVELLKLKKGSTILDIACGKGELITRIAERYEVLGVGVDLSSYFAAHTKRKLKERAPSTNLEILEMDGADYRSNRLFDLSMCIGASWIFRGHRGTLKALRSLTKPGGLIITGEPFWIKEPEQAYLEAENCTREAWGTHSENVLTGEDEGLFPLYTLVSNQDDWDRYETLQWWAAKDFTRANPDDKDIQEVLEMIDLQRKIYLRWGRNTVGWAIYVFQNKG
jgi:SAM-dependent methyltransferase